MRRPTAERFSAFRSATAVRRFLRDEEGYVLPLATLMLLTIIGGTLLAVDGARHANLQTDLQKAADAAALAAAAELDQRPGALDRARDAATALVANQQATGTTPGLVAVDLRFLKSLPASDDAAIDGRHATNSAAEARFVEARVQPVALDTIMPAASFGAAGRVSSSAVAVAGFDQAVCDFTPVYICNPFEGSSYSLTQAMQDPRLRRRLIQMKQQGSGASYFPGNFGFLQPPGGQGASAIRDMVARARPPGCYLRSGVELATGTMASVRNAFNVRFDIYEGDQSKNKGDPEYRPAANVRKGYSTSSGGDACNAKPSTDPSKARGLTRDTCFLSGTCFSSDFAVSMRNRVGNGLWDFEGYWAVNHGSTPKPPPKGGLAHTNADPPSRYDVYRYEIEKGLIANASPGGERGTPACFAGATSDDPDRRLIYGAVLDCMALNDPANGGPIRGGSSDRLPVTAFARFFITEPIENGKDDTLWVEMVDVFEPGVKNDVSRDLIQLYR
jgi:hypothetical protein